MGAEMLGNPPLKVVGGAHIIAAARFTSENIGEGHQKW
jgi:hypothetical protein